MTYVKIVDGVIVQKQPYEEDGFVEAPDTVVVGYLYDEGTGQYSAPPPPEPEPIDPLGETLTKRQINAALILSGVTTEPDTFIETAIGGIVDPTQRALALNDWRNAPYYERTHPLFNDPDLLVAVGMTEQQIDQLWALGWQQLR